jgi:hypothetical protein
MISVPLGSDGLPMNPNRAVLTEALRTCERYTAKRDFPGGDQFFFVVSVLSAGRWIDYRVGPGAHPEEVIQATELMAHEAGRYHG